MMQAPYQPPLPPQLSRCSDCNHPVSFRAERCPRCGAPFANDRLEWNGGMVVGTILILVAIIGQVVGATTMEPSHNLLLGLEGIVIGALVVLVGALGRRRR